MFCVFCFLQISNDTYLHNMLRTYVISRLTFHSLGQSSPVQSRPVPTYFHICFRLSNSYLVVLDLLLCNLASDVVDVVVVILSFRSNPVVGMDCIAIWTSSHNLVIRLHKSKKCPSTCVSYKIR